MAKKKVSAKVISQKILADGIYDLRLETEITEDAVPGQFVGVYTDDKSSLLPRPISICGVDKEKNELRLVYRVVGKGTDLFSKLSEGDQVDVLGPLGNGYPMEEAAGKTAILMGGGIGVPPLLELAKRLTRLPEDKRPKDIKIVMGYRNNQTFLADEFRKYAELYIATDDGSLGTHGTVIDALNEQNIEGDVIYTCGPMPMLRGIKKYAAEHNMKAYLSLEEKMACGVGACLGCVVATKEKDAHSHVNNARICTDGPVFDADVVDI
ncbi:dihydroorotate dehydrogenase electron transfer subunit [Butyrivibrio fibrisolvens]|uniref:dihydroorotate dehydrogenase electron transfer subunit n=1 Tax=Butyrivibrio fibrisolvens TaxID=831 RepID=UPI0004258C1B|nr:dihydroorotate dehydrogenase electron transfer subunit [Butyrivibrio fibrisolvens]